MERVRIMETSSWEATGPVTAHLLGRRPPKSHELAFQVAGRDPAAESILVAASYDDSAAESSLVALYCDERTDSSFVTNLCAKVPHKYRVLPFFPAPHASAFPMLPQRVSEPAQSAMSATSNVKQSVEGCGSSSCLNNGQKTGMWVAVEESPLVMNVFKPLPDRCHPCFLCKACANYWGTSGLPERVFFGNLEEKLFRRSPEEDITPILSSQATAARKRKWNQTRGPKSKTSEYRGVNFYRRTNKWEAHIWHEGKQLYLGASIDKVHAAQAYDKAALFLFGADAEINFKPEGYQKEFEFIHRLTYGQMLVYLQRESKQSGEEVKYPGVAMNLSTQVFVASYRPTKFKASHVHIGLFKTEDDAVRAVMREAKNRKNWEMAGKIMEVHHLRTVRPAPGKSPQNSRARGACKVPATEVAASTGPANSPNPPAKRARRADPVEPTAGAVIPAQETRAALRNRNSTKKTTKTTASPAAKKKALEPLTLEVVVPVLEAAHIKRKYNRKSKKTQDTSIPETSTPGPLRQDAIAPGLVPVATANVAPPSQDVGGGRLTKQSYTNRKPRKSAAPARAALSGSSCLSFQSELDSFRTPPARRKPTDEEARQIQEAALAIARRNPPCRAPNPQRPADNASASSDVIRPVARRLQPPQWMCDNGIGAAAVGSELSANKFPRGRGGGGRIYVDLFGPPNSPVVSGDGADSEIASHEFDE